MYQHFAFWCWLTCSFLSSAPLAWWSWRRWSVSYPMCWASFWGHRSPPSAPYRFGHPLVAKTANVLRADELDPRPNLRNVLSAILVLCLAAVTAAAGPADAVVRLPSHGGSGTAIATGDGWTLILSCAHCFEGASRNKPVVVNMPSPEPGQPRKVGSKVLAVGHAEDVDLSLIRLNVGPVPYVTPVASLSTRGPECWSVGFDEMKFPPTVKHARIIGGLNPNTTTTDNRPWHGRSGGALIDKRTGSLVGVVSAYSGPSNHADLLPGHFGIYVSLPAIHRFLRQAGAMQGSPGPEPIQQRLQQPFRQAFPQPGGT